MFARWPGGRGEEVLAGLGTVQPEKRQEVQRLPLGTIVGRLARRGAIGLFIDLPEFVSAGDFVGAVGMIHAEFLVLGGPRFRRGGCPLLARLFRSLDAQVQRLSGCGLFQDLCQGYSATAGVGCHEPGCRQDDRGHGSRQSTPNNDEHFGFPDRRGGFVCGRLKRLGRFGTQPGEKLLVGRKSRILRGAEHFRQPVFVPIVIWIRHCTRSSLPDV